MNVATGEQVLFNLASGSGKVSVIISMPRKNCTLCAFSRFQPSGYDTAADAFTKDKFQAYVAKCPFCRGNERQYCPDSLGRLFPGCVDALRIPFVCIPLLS